LNDPGTSLRIVYAWMVQGAGLTVRDDGEAVDVQEVARPLQAKDARSGVQIVGLRGADAGINTQVTDVEAGIVGAGGAGVRLGEVEGPLVKGGNAAPRDLGAGGQSGRQAKGEGGESEQALFHL
jgi:hypothetical protein